MRLLNQGRSESTQFKSNPIFRGPEDEFADESRRIRFLVNAWLKSQDQSLPNSPVPRRIERKLHEAIKAGPLFGKVLSFAGLNLWVDDRTLDGLVNSQESINL